MSRRNVLLLYPRYTYPRKSPPLGLAYLAAYLEESNFKPNIIDFNTSDISNDKLSDLLKAKLWLFIGISFMTNQFREASMLAKTIKANMPDIPLVVGGPHASSIPEKTLKEIPEIDFIVKGEGEETARELAGQLFQHESVEQVKGIYFRKNDDIVKTPERDFIKDLDSVPFPAWKYLDVKKYDVFSICKEGNAPRFALLSSRGCPNECVFCDSHTIFSRKYRARTALNIYNEIIYLHNTYGMTEFDFVDDLITVAKPRVLELCDLIRGSGIAFKWMANARVNTVDYEMLHAMKTAGCIRVDYGVESGDPEVRKLMKKRITNDQIKRAHEMARDVGMSTGSFTMVGNLGENSNSVEMTVKLLKDIGDDVMVSIACPFPGTELYRIAKDNKYLNSEDWTKYVTSPTYTENYYPVMRTDCMTEDEILNSYYYLNSYYAARKFKRRFGRFFYLSPTFYKEWVFKWENIGKRFSMALKLISSRVRAPKETGVRH